MPLFRSATARHCARYLCGVWLAAFMGCLNPRPDVDPSVDEREPTGIAGSGAGGGAGSAPINSGGAGNATGGAAGAFSGGAGAAGAAPNVPGPDAGVDGGGPNPNSESDGGAEPPEAGAGGDDAGG